MIVVTLTNCPPKVRGDLSKWLMEINTGVYVGNLSARVRDELWQRICENVGTGRVTMVFSAPGEQHLDYYVHNTSWEPVDYDGIKLMRHPFAARRERQKPHDVKVQKSGFSDAAKIRKLRRMEAIQRANQEKQNFTVIDLETTGLLSQSDLIIELAALRVRGQQAEESFSKLIRIEKSIPTEITKLTGITDDLLKSNGISEKEALEQFVAFIGTDRIVGYNVQFDLSFLKSACRRYNIKLQTENFTDLMKLARRKIETLENYQLTTLAKHFGLDTAGMHRALVDCRLAFSVYMKLNENDSE